MQLTGAEIIVECLKEQGVDTVFGYPGGAILNVYDALYEYKDEITHVLTSHEQGASHAADGYARAGGQVGVCIATSGPGATNLVTGLANAFLDSIPVVAITGQVPVAMIGRDAFQEVDITGITMPITKHNFLVKRPEHLAQTIRLAFQLAKTGRPGPVLVDVPRDVQTALLDYEPGELEPLAKELPEEKQIAAAVAAREVAAQRTFPEERIEPVLGDSRGVKVGKNIEGQTLAQPQAATGHGLLPPFGSLLALRVHIGRVVGGFLGYGVELLVFGRADR